MAERLRSLSAGGRFSGCVSPSSDLRDVLYLELELLLLVVCSDLNDLSGDLEGDLDDVFLLDELAEYCRFSLDSAFFFGEEDFPKRFGRTIGEDDALWAQDKSCVEYGLAKPEFVRGEVSPAALPLRPSEKCSHLFGRLSFLFFLLGVTPRLLEYYSSLSATWSQLFGAVGSTAFQPGSNR